MIYYLIIVVLILIVLDLLMNHNKVARYMKRMPGPKGRFLIGNTLDVLGSPEELFQLPRKWANAANGLYSLWIWPLKIVNIYNPEDIEKIVSTTKFNEKNITYTFLGPWLQEGLLLSKGTKWHNRRKILTPAFHFNILKEFCGILEDNSQRLMEQLKKTNGQYTNIIPVISEYTLNSICETAMGTRLTDTKDGGKSYKEAVYALGNIVIQRFMRIFLIPDLTFNFTKWGREQKKQLKVLHEFTKNVIGKRKEYVKVHGYNLFDSKYVEDNIFMTSRKKKYAMMDLLLLAEKDGHIDSKGVQEEVDTFMFEGHDTTASALTYGLMALANHKDVQDKIAAELYEIFGESDRVATIDDFSRMCYLDCCLKEILRLYPPVPFIGRLIDEEVELSNYKILPNTVLFIHIYDLHRREEYFKNAEQFDPGRFLPENSVGRHPYSYIPFSAGPRNCIGQKFAMLELKSCVSAILRNFALEPVTLESEVVFMSDLVLRSVGPISVKFVPRSKLI